jgi:diguanylate cyclase (GGDEF)-like protein
VAVLYIDVDRFKVVNDSLGHDAGDQLLVALAERLTMAVRPSDTVARVGGDEFVVVCESLTGVEGAARVAERVLVALGAPIALGGHPHHVGVSIGIAATEDPVASADDLLRDADAAMYRAKERGGDRFEIFGEALRCHSRALFELERELRLALGRDELAVHYQPVMTLDGRAVAVEALARWEHGERGLMSPADFIPLAEQTGLIVPLGELVLDRACAQLARWRAGQPELAELELSVNLSSRQITQPDVVEMVARALRRHDLPPSALCLEITESMLMDDTDAAGSTLAALRNLGVKLAVDDFGTGYSSLLYLQRFPVNILKLDRLFVAGVGENEADRAIVASMVSLAHALGLIAIAEGVEDERQLAALCELGCDLGQGFLWARPATADEVLPALLP